MGGGWGESCAVTTCRRVCPSWIQPGALLRMPWCDTAASNELHQSLDAIIQELA